MSAGLAAIGDTEVERTAKAISAARRAEIVIHRPPDAVGGAVGGRP
jgi:hypothetical protein